MKNILPSSPKVRMAMRLAIAVLIALASVLPAVEIVVEPGGPADGDGSAARPAGSLQRAQALAQTALSTGGDEVVVTMRGGVWRLDEPLVFTAVDGGGAKRWCTWRAAPGTAPVLSAGQPLDGWKDLGDGRWAAPLPDGPEPEQLLVNNQWAEPARNQGLLRLEKAERDQSAPKDCGWRITIGDNVKLPDPGTGALRMVIRKTWATYMAPVIAISNKTATLSVEAWMAPQWPGDYTFLGGNNTWRSPRISLEGHPDLLTDPGTWAVDRAGRRLLYRPRPGETLDKVQVERPYGKGVLSIAGTLEQPVMGLRFEGLTFSHASWRWPVTGWNEIQAGVRMGPPGTNAAQDRAILCKAKFWRRGGLTDVSLRLSGDDGLLLDEGCSDLSINRCTVSDLGGTGITVGTAKDWPLDDPHLVRGISISDCAVVRCGRVRLGSVGVCVFIARDCRIERSEVAYLPYTGISLGWRWEATPTSAGGHLVLSNHVHHVVQSMVDGGGIYSLGNQSVSRMAGNRIHEIRHRYDGHAGTKVSGIYLDEGSLGWTVENNLIYDIDENPISLHRLGLNKTGKTPTIPTESTNVFKGNTVGMTKEGFAADQSPPYGKKSTRYSDKATNSLAVVWGENKTISPDRWAVESPAILAQWTVERKR